MTTSRLTLATIVATIGPASQSSDAVRRLILAGVNVFRFNFSHGSAEDHAARLRIVREASRDLDRPVAVLGDLPGPKIRVTQVADPGITLEPGQDVLLDPTRAAAAESSVGVGGATMLGCTVPGIASAVAPGHRVLINDGAIRLLCVDKAAGDPAEAIRCRVLVGGLVTTGKGINFPQSNIAVAALTDRDRSWAAWAVEHELDYLALSFVRTAAEVRGLRSLVSSGKGGAIPIVAKIEKPQAVEAIDEIADAADAIMVARGDLGVETDVAQVPVIQKRVIAAAARHGKPCIVATQMLESMITSASPTRAEASDVANAIFDGADAVMLSGETAVGKNPVLAVETMKRIVSAAEAAIAESARAGEPLQAESAGRGATQELAAGVRTAALAHAAWHAARAVHAKAVVVWSQRGGAARHLSLAGFHVPILAYSSAPEVTRRMQLLRGVTARCAAPAQSLAAWNELADEDLIALQLARPGDPVVLIAGMPLGVQGTPNMIAFHKVGDSCGGFLGARA